MVGYGALNTPAKPGLESLGFLSFLGACFLSLKIIVFDGPDPVLKKSVRGFVRGNVGGDNVTAGGRGFNLVAESGMV